MGIEPTSSAWKAEVLPLNYTRLEPIPDPPNPNVRARPASANEKPEAVLWTCARTARPRDLRSLLWQGVNSSRLVEGGGFEPPKAEPSDLQSDPFDRSGTPPEMQASNCLAHPVRLSTGFNILNKVSGACSSTPLRGKHVFPAGDCRRGMQTWGSRGALPP
jgi:hypothetical protein